MVFLRVWVLLLLPLLLRAPAPVEHAALSSGSTTYPFVLSSGYYEYFPVDAFTTTVVQYSLASSARISIAFMTSSQFQAFNSSNGPVSNSIVYNNASSASRTLTVGQGYYDILVYAYDRTANATLTLTISPSNPFEFGPLPPPEPSGIVSYGLTNQSGVDTPYTVSSTDVVGLASISSMEAYNSTAGSVSANPSGATLQLNSLLVVNERGGGTQVYWCQDTPDFVTSAHQVALADNVWNYSLSGFLSNDSVTSQGGGGYVSTFQQDGQTEYYYAFEQSNSSYALPLGVVLLINATAQPGTGVMVQFGASLTGGVLGRPGTLWFDNVTIHDPSVTSSYFQTTGNYSDPYSTFYDAELVFAGEGNGEATSFAQLDASLGLFYANGTSHSLTAFPSYFSFGQDTAEAADNLMMRYLGNGEAGVSVGTPNYVYLGSASGNYSLAGIEGSLGFPESPGSSFTTATTPSSSGSGGTTTASSQSTAGLGNGIPEFPYQGLAVVVAIAILLVSYILVRRRSPCLTVGFSR